MQGNFIPSANWTEPVEGGYSCRRGDGGNWTLGRVGAGLLVGSMKGVSAPTMVLCLGDESLVTAQVMQAIDTTQYRAIGNAYYWRALNGDRLPSGVDHMLWDFGYNSGVSRAARQVQVVVGLGGRDLDGDIGEQTLDALNTAPIATIVSCIPPKPARVLQALCGLSGDRLDGVIGPITQAAIVAHGMRAQAVIYALASAQEAAYRTFRTFPTDGDGWLSRLRGRVAFALAAAAAASGSTAAS